MVHCVVRCAIVHHYYPKPKSSHRPMNKSEMVALAGFCLVALCCVGNGVRGAEVRVHNGRPMVFVDGQPNPLPAYSPVRYEVFFVKETPRFFRHRMGAYFLSVPYDETSGDLACSVFWKGDRVSSTPAGKTKFSLDDQAVFVLKGDPEAHLIIRFGLREPKTWAALHQDQMVVNEKGETLQVPSLASDLYWDYASRLCRAVIEHCESRPWADRIIGYAQFHRVEGSHEPLMRYWLYDHSSHMTRRWRGYLKEKYQTVERLREAYGDPELTFENAQVPTDSLRGSVSEVASLLYWQDAKDNRPLRDYLLLTRDLFHQRFRQISRAMRDATDRKRFFVHDALKQVMLGWDNRAFFALQTSWQFAYPEQMAGSGHMNVAALFDAEGCDGLITPHDYQARSVGGIFEPEGIADSAVLRGELFLCEMDLRTWADRRTRRNHGAYGCARNMVEFEAISWRNLATALTRGFSLYWMDQVSDWFSTEEIHKVIARQVQVIKESANWPHRTMPGIAMILDDSAVLETNGAGNFFNEAIMWEQKMGLARCGVPYRIYLLEDLALENFPRHRVFYFPNLFRVDDRRLALLRDKVFRDGNVVVWGPGSGISDGNRIGPRSASKLTGFEFHYLRANYPRRTLITDFTHPITRGVSADTVIGGPLAYGPMLFPRDGHSLGLAWTKQGRNYSGLSVKSFGKGAAGVYKGKEPLGPGDYAAVFTTAVPLPADLWRGLARFAGTHIYCETNDILLADSSVVALHSIKSGKKRIALPGQFAVEDLITGERVAGQTDEIAFDLEAPATRVFLLRPAAASSQPAGGHHVQAN